MRIEHIQYLACPECHGDLKLASVEKQVDDRVESGQLSCVSCDAEYPVIRNVPRFVPIENYASSFGLEWTKHALTQYDSYTGLNLSQQRFTEETRWPRDLTGQIILEAGSGSGRFTEQAVKTHALVVSMDYSYAVEANYQSNGKLDNVLIIQGNIYQMPFRPDTFDKIFCFGVLQHTPDVKGAFLALPKVLKPGGEVVVDVYKKTIFSLVLHTKYYVRPITRRISPEKLYGLTKKWVDLMWPLHTLIRKIPKIGHSINWRLLVADYSTWGVDGQLLKEWAYLDTFDMLGPRYDSPQTLSTMKRWFEESELEDVDVSYGYNGIEGRGKKPLCVA